MNYENEANHAVETLMSDYNQRHCHCIDPSDFVQIIRKTGYIVILKTKFYSMSIKNKKLLLKDCVKVIY